MYEEAPCFRLGPRVRYTGTVHREHAVGEGVQGPAGVQHWRFVFSALVEHHVPGEVYLHEAGAHGVDGGGIRGILVALFNWMGRHTSGTS